MRYREAQMHALLNRKNGGAVHAEACQWVADFSPGEENSSEEAYNNPVCVQGRTIPPVVRVRKCRQRR